MISCMWEANGDIKCQESQPEHFTSGSIYNINVIIMSRDETDILYNYTNKRLYGRGMTHIMRYAPPVLAIQEKGCVVLVRDMTNYTVAPRPDPLKLMMKYGPMGTLIPITFNNTLSLSNISMRTGRVEIKQIGSAGLELLLGL